MNREFGGEGREGTDRQTLPSAEKDKAKPSIFDAVQGHLAKVDTFAARAALLKAERKSLESDSTRIAEIGAKLGVPLNRSIDEKQEDLKGADDAIVRTETQAVQAQEAADGVAGLKNSPKAALFDQ